MEKSIQDKISAILFKHDPVNLDFVDNTDEYDSEARMILEQIHIASDVDELEKIIIKIFITMFNDDRIVDRSKADWKKTAEEIWDVNQENTSLASND